MSDLHFGSGEDLLRAPEILERVLPHLEWADTLILNGDVFELLTASLEDAVDASRKFFGEVSDLINNLIFLPGNHDYHFVAVNSDQKRLAEFIGAEVEPFRLVTLERLLGSLTSDIEVEAHYPVHTVDGITFHHGHYMTPHLRSAGFGAQVLDRIAWRLAGLERDREQLSVTDYEALLAPLHELLYQAGQLPSSSRTRDNGERLLNMALKAVKAPGRIGRKVAKLTSPDDTNPTALFTLLRPETAARGLAEAFRNIGVSAGQVCFGHSHSPCLGFRHQSWVFHNSGSWVLNKREVAFPGYRRFAWPGTILRIEDGNVTRHDLLDDFSTGDLIRLLKNLK